jgi:hypothetical protein
MEQRAHLVALFVAWIVLGPFGCTLAPAPLPAAVPPPAAERAIVVLVPGTTGSRLVERDSGRVRWGDGASLWGPRDGGYALALALRGASDGSPGSTGVASEPRALVPAGVVGEIRLGRFVRKPVYDPLAERFAAAGFRRGDLERPRPEERYFEFAYDWRRDLVETAGLLRGRLAALGAAHRATGADRPPPVVLLCQSSGALVCRYLVKYGGAPLEEAEAGRAGPPPEPAIADLVLVGAANGGSLRTFGFLDRGRRYLPAGRVFHPEVLFTWPGLFADLPASGAGRFLDEAGRPLAADLHDPESWRRHGWSVFAGAAARRAGRRPDLFGGEAERLAHLARALDRARRFQALLARDAHGFGAERLHLIGNFSAPTPERAVLLPRRGAWLTLLAGDRWLADRPALLAATVASGDAHATRASQLLLSPQERSALAGEPFAARGGHFEQLLDPATDERLLAIAAVAGLTEAVKGSPGGGDPIDRPTPP